MHKVWLKLAGYAAAKVKVWPCSSKSQSAAMQQQKSKCGYAAAKVLSVAMQQQKS